MPPLTHPAAGKTYLGVQLMKVVLHNTRNALRRDLPGDARPDVGPILMACFTNHALDSFLESLLDAGVSEGIVRVGGRGKSERLAAFNLKELVQPAGGWALLPGWDWGAVQGAGYCCCYCDVQCCHVWWCVLWFCTLGLQRQQLDASTAT